MNGIKMRYYLGPCALHRFAVLDLMSNHRLLSGLRSRRLRLHGLGNLSSDTCNDDVEEDLNGEDGFGL